MNKVFQNQEKCVKIEENWNQKEKNKMKKLKLTELLEGIEDTRRTRSVMYPLTEVLFIMLVGNYSEPLSKDGHRIAHNSKTNRIESGKAVLDCCGNI